MSIITCVRRFVMYTTPSRLDHSLTEIPSKRTHLGRIPGPPWTCIREMPMKFKRHLFKNRAPQL